MKTNYNYLFALLILIIGVTANYSCTKDTISNNDSDKGKVNLNTILEMRSFTNEKLLKLSYATLNSSEKKGIWIENIRYYINSGILTKIQINQLNKLSNRLTPEVFSKTDENFIVFSKEWVKESLKSFTKEQLKSMLASLTLLPIETLKLKYSLTSINAKSSSLNCEDLQCPPGQTVESENGICECVNIAEKKDCNCKSKNFIFTLCRGSDECTDLIPKCKRTEFCGFLYIEDCDGRCKS